MFQFDWEQPYSIIFALVMPKILLFTVTNWKEKFLKMMSYHAQSQLQVFSNFPYFNL